MIVGVDDPCYGVVSTWRTGSARQKVETTHPPTSKESLLDVDGHPVDFGPDPPPARKGPLLGSDRRCGFCGPAHHFGRVPVRPLLSAATTSERPRSVAIINGVFPVASFTSFVFTTDASTRTTSTGATVAAA